MKTSGQFHAVTWFSSLFAVVSELFPSRASRRRGRGAGVSGDDTVYARGTPVGRYSYQYSDYTKSIRTTRASHDGFQL